MNSKRLASIAILPILAGLTFTTGSASAATDGDGREVNKNGNCSQRADWKMKAKNENRNRVEIEFEVDSNVSGQVWSVVITDNGQTVFSGDRTTGGRSGSFSVEKKVPNRAGIDSFVATATNAANGETCEGALAF